MIFLSGLVVLALAFGLGIGCALQRDEWFLRWVGVLRSWQWVAGNEWLSLVLSVFLPVLVLSGLLLSIAYLLSSNWLFFIYVPVLFYSLGRGDLRTDVAHYLALTQRGDTVAASHWVDKMSGGAELDDHGVDVDDWQKLHTQALDVISYRGYERLFAVIFWFFVLPGVGALLYRLTVIYQHQLIASADSGTLAKRWLWLLEWPGARALGLTWALVGNFDSCYSILKNNFLDLSHSSMDFLSSSLRGALGMTPMSDERGNELQGANQVDDSSTLAPPVISGINTEPDSYGLISAGLALFSRALLLWLCVIALVTLAL